MTPPVKVVGQISCWQWSLIHFKHKPLDYTWARILNVRIWTWIIIILFKGSDPPPERPSESCSCNSLHPNDKHAQCAIRQNAVELCCINFMSSVTFCRPISNRNTIKSVTSTLKMLHAFNIIDAGTSGNVKPIIVPNEGWFYKNNNPVSCIFLNCSFSTFSIHFLITVLLACSGSFSPGQW